MEEKFYKILDNTKKIKKSAFENNWPYILQATRNGLYTIESEDSIIYYTYRVVNDDSCLVIVNALGPNKEKLIINFVKKQSEKGKKIIIKNIDKSEVDWWLQNNFIETSEPWSEYSFRDDNSFPQYNISRKIIDSNKFGRYLRYQMRRFGKQRKIITQLYDTKNEEMAQKLLIDFSIYSENKGNDSSVEIERGHQFFFDESIRNKIRLQHIENDELIGFSFLTPVLDIAFYNALICKSQNNLMKYLLLESIKFVMKEHPHLVIFGMQGSENKGQDFFKRRFKPTETIEKTHLIYKKR